jgi:hypothetical protein
VTLVSLRSAGDALRALRALLVHVMALDRCRAEPASRPGEPLSAPADVQRFFEKRGVRVPSVSHHPCFLF